jgi:hypothetical protein
MTSRRVRGHATVRHATRGRKKKQEEKHHIQAEQRNAVSTPFPRRFFSFLNLNF